MRAVISGGVAGLVGALVKPVAGFVDLVALTSEGIRNTPQYLRKTPVVVRLRLPRTWPAGAPVTPFDRRAAIGCLPLLVPAPV